MKQNQSMQSRLNLCDRAQLFGRTVADSLMQYDSNDWQLLQKHDWQLLQKQIIHLFFEHEQQRCNNAGFNFPMYTKVHQLSQHNQLQQPDVHKGVYPSFLQSIQMPYSPSNGSSHSNESYTN